MHQLFPSSMLEGHASNPQGQSIPNPPELSALHIYCSQGPELGDRNAQIWEMPTMTAPLPAVLPTVALAGFGVVERARQRRRARSVRVCLLVSPHHTKSSEASSTSTAQRLATSLGAALHTIPLLLPAAGATDCNVEPLLRPQLLWRGDLVLRGVCDWPKTHSPTSVLIGGSGAAMAEKRRELRLPGACLYQPGPPSQPLPHTAEAITVPAAAATSLSVAAGGGECSPSSATDVRVEVGWELEVIQALSEPLPAHLLAAGAPMVLGVESGVGTIKGGSDPGAASGVFAEKHERHTAQVVRELMEGCVGGKAAAGLLARFRPQPSAADTTPQSPAAPASSLLSTSPPSSSPPPLLLLYAHRGALYGCVAYCVETSTIVLRRE